MKKTKGLVMRTSPKVTAVFTEGGDFLEIPTPKEPPVVGQTIEVSINPRRLFVFHNSTLKYASVAAVLFLVLSISVFYLFIPNMAVASVALDINKGVELLINKDGKVIKVQDVNDGSSIVEGLSIKGLNVYQAVDLILGNANYKGTLNETHNLILASVVPVNKWGAYIIDTEKLRDSIRDEMTRRNMFGSVVVSQANEKIHQEAKQHGMTVNSYLIYDRCEAKGIAIQPDTLRNDAQKALLNAKVSVSNLFPEESFEVRAQDLKDNSTDTMREPNVKESSEYEHPSNMESNTTEDHSYTNPSNTGEIGHESETTQHTTPPVTQPVPTGETGHETDTTHHTTTSVTPPAPTGETDHENDTTHTPRHQ
ncbi:MAG TPA: anti-sigma factor domain-containing protein [Desulfosporosinus sp.]|nr:anti-sigma factor domain-containing protein [Desulfosporosinus sp.]